MWLLLACLAHALDPAGGAPAPVDYVAWAAAEPIVAHPEPAYHYAAELHRAIAPLVAARPGVVRPFVVGRTVNGRPIWGFRVSSPGDAPAPGLPKKKLLVFAQIHALEWVPSEIAVAFLTEIAAHPLEGVEITVIPSLNPDGRAKVEADLLAGDNKYRRGNADNVDLNRDFPVNREAKAVWRHLIPGRYATSPAPLSQPESRALDALAETERFDVAVSLHSFGGFLYYPWAGLWERPKDWAEMQRLGLVMQAAMGAHAYKPRQLARWGFFFRGHGMEIDHLYGTYGTKAFLIETTRSGFSLARPEDWGNHFRWYNPKEPERHVREGLRALRALAHDIGGRLG
ncbi:MAG: M14 family zinc carboxypeptidase [Pseudomonadota bacterium]|nr:M14 family zinc carboxypeptidase [Pseudomonadota bacterium]